MHDSEPSTVRPASTATAALAQGRPDERRDVGADLAMARVRGALFRRAATAPKLGRYNVLHQLGAGAHGVVYAAYDDRLDRKVAIKVVHADCAVGEVVAVQARLMREARALAKLTHPNVVAIYDVMPVETDADGPVTRAEVMLAMEYVGGKTLREWADRDSQPWQEVLAVYRQAAQGLAAAHAHDLVHCDFKPANAMLGEDGRVRVLDFGLARFGRANAPLTHASELAESLAAAEKSGTLGVLAQARTGIVGTPRYMPPEQHLGHPATASSDQYSLCAALWEALAGQPPFVGDNLEALHRQKQKPELTVRDTGVPAKIWSALRRGLAPDPAKRHASIDALLKELAHDPIPWWRWTAGLVALGLVGGVAASWPQASADRCADTAAPLRLLWSSARRQTLAASFVATKRPYAAAAWSGAQRSVERWTQQWRTARLDACEAQRAGTQSAELFDLRNACLDAHLNRLGALLDVYETADDAVVDNALRAAQGLPAVALCNEAKRLRAAAPLPDDPGQRQRVEDLLLMLTRAEVNIDGGRYDVARTIAAEVTDAYETHAVQYAPLQARALLVRGDARGRLGRDFAIDDLERALMLAQSNGQDLLFARAAVALVNEESESKGNFERAALWAKLGEAALARGGLDPYVLATLHSSAGGALMNAGKFDDALVRYQRGLELAEEHFGADDRLVAVAHMNIGNIHNQRGEFEPAMEHYARGIKIATEVLGAEHPNVLSTRQNRMGLMWRHQLRGEALTEGNEVLAAQTRVLGPRHPDLVFTLGNLAVMANDTAAYDKAKAFSERALAIADDTTLAAWATMVPLLQLATASGHLGKLDLAFERGNAALALSQRTLGTEHVTTAEALSVLGMLHAHGRDIDAARREYARARKIFAANELPMRVAQTDGSLAFAEYRSGNPDLALTLAHAAVDRLQSLDPGGRDLAHALLIVGAIQGSQGRPENAPLVQARALYRALGLPVPDLDAP